MNAETAARSLNEIFFHRIPMPLEFLVEMNANACEIHAENFLIGLLPPRMRSMTMQKPHLGIRKQVSSGLQDLKSQRLTNLNLNVRSYKELHCDFFYCLWIAKECVVKFVLTSFKAAFESAFVMVDICGWSSVLCLLRCHGDKVVFHHPSFWIELGHVKWQS